MKYANNIRLNKICKSIIEFKSLNHLKDNDIKFTIEYLNKFNNKDSRTLKSLLLRFDLALELVNTYKAIKFIDNLDKIDYQAFYDKIFDKLDNNQDNQDNDLKVYDNKQAIDITVNNLLEHYNKDNKYFIVIKNLDKLFDKIFNYYNDIEFIINKDISDFNTNDLIAIRISFNNYYDNKFVYYYALKLLKFYEFDKSYYYAIFTKKSFIDNIHKFNFKYKNFKQYVNKYSYYKSAINRFNHINKLYKPYNTKKFDNILFSDNLLEIKEHINNTFIYFLNIDINKYINDIYNDYLLLLNLNDKNHLINKALNYINDIFNTIDYLSLNRYYKNQVDNTINDINQLFSDLLKDNDLFNEYSVYNQDIFKTKMNKHNIRKKTNVIDNYYYLDNDNNNYNTLECIFTLKE